MKLFQEYVNNITENFNDKLNMNIYKELKKRYKKKFTYTEDEFEPEDTFEFKFQENKFKIYINCKDYNKCVYNYEWI